MNKPITVIGFDPSLSNWGYSIGLYDNKLSIYDTGVIQTKPSKKKQTQNLKDLDRCFTLYSGLSDLITEHNPDKIFVELPTGSQSSRAMVSYAVCIAYTACLCHKDIPVISITPNQIKRYVGASDASKDDVINLVKQLHPYLKLPAKSKAEHICDSILAIHVGLNL